MKGAIALIILGVILISDGAIRIVLGFLNVLPAIRQTV